MALHRPRRGGADGRPRRPPGRRGAVARDHGGPSRRLQPVLERLVLPPPRLPGRHGRPRTGARRRFRPRRTRQVRAHRGGVPDPAARQSVHGEICAGGVFQDGHGRSRPGPDPGTLRPHGERRPADHPLRGLGRRTEGLRRRHVQPRLERRPGHRHRGVPLRHPSAGSGLPPLRGRSAARRPAAGGHLLPDRRGHHRLRLEGR